MQTVTGALDTPASIQQGLWVLSSRMYFKGACALASVPGLEGVGGYMVLSGEVQRGPCH